MGTRSYEIIEQGIQDRISIRFYRKSGINVKIFCYMDAVNNVQTGQKKVPGVTNMEEAFKEIIAKGAEIKLCTLCLLVRGIKDLIEGTKKSGTPDVADMIEGSDRFLIVC